VAQSLVDKEFVEYKKHRYMIQRRGTTAVDVTVGDADDDSQRERSILVMDVPEHLTDEVVCLLESERKGGGQIELQKRDSSTGVVLFTFVSKDGQFTHICILRNSLLASLFSCVVLTFEN